MKRVLFISGTRADYGKIKPLVRAVDAEPGYSAELFMTGMHMLERFGMTVHEAEKDGFTIKRWVNQSENEAMELVVSTTIEGLSRMYHQTPDLIVVHGDRAEALAGATFGVMRNTLVAHIEGGESSGSVDDTLRHAITKLADRHFVANETAAAVVRGLGEERVYTIGSPEVDALVRDSGLGSVARARYDLPSGPLGICIVHPVTTDAGETRAAARAAVDAVLASGDRFWLVIEPNNDAHASVVRDEYQRLHGPSWVRVLPSVRFELYLALLREADVLIGNTSSGVREAPVLGTPSVNIGTRQRGRASAPSIVSVEPTSDAVLAAMSSLPPRTPTRAFGDGNATSLFMRALREDGFWDA